jgi:hypothetical protein
MRANLLLPSHPQQIRPCKPTATQPSSANPAVLVEEWLKSRNGRNQQMSRIEEVDEIEEVDGMEGMDRMKERKGAQTLWTRLKKQTAGIGQPEWLRHKADSMTKSRDDNLL